MTPIKQMSLRGLIPSVKDLSNSPKGTVVYYEVDDFSVVSNLISVGKRLGASLETTAHYAMKSRDPKELTKLIRVVVAESAAQAPALEAQGETDYDA